MGAVYEAVDQRLRHTVALKETFMETEELRRAFEREAHLLANLNHPSLPRVIDYFAENNTEYLVMDFVPGDDLNTLLEKTRTPFSVEDVLSWPDNLLDALHYLHSHNPPIIHRDIKPSNLKLNSTGKIVLLDFGLAKGMAGQMSIGASSRSILGYSPHYASLEQMEGDKTSPLSDLYSLGATLYQLLTGKVPPDALSRANAMLHDEIDPLRHIRELNPAVPSRLADELMRCLSLKPSLRPKSAAAMRTALREDITASTNDFATLDLSETTITQSPLPRSRSLVRPSILTSSIVTGLGVVLFIGLLIVGYILFRQTTTPLDQNAATQIPSGNASPTQAQNSDADMNSNTSSSTNTPVQNGVSWPSERDTDGVYVATSSETIPTFPLTLSGYRSENGRDFWGKRFVTKGTLRIFEGRGWEVIPDFPLTMNGCSAGVFMIRWRSANPDVQVAGALGYHYSGVITPKKQGPLATCKVVIVRNRCSSSFVLIMVTSQLWLISITS